MPDREEPWPWLAGAGPGTGAGSGPEPLSDVVARRLLAQRVVLLHGPLDDLSVTRVSAELMTLDAEGDEPVTLRVDCGEAALAPALTLMDVIELMGVPVRALCLGQVGSGAIGVVAVCAHRSAMPSTRFSLSEPATQLQAHVRNVAQWAELRGGRAAALLRPRRPPPRASRRRRSRSDLERGRFLARPRRPSTTGSSTRCAGPTPRCGACPDPGRRPWDSGRCADGGREPARDRAGPACLRCGDDHDRAPSAATRPRASGTTS